MNKPSLRDFKKEATARTLAEAAFGLALERGLDGFVVEDAVNRAGYSRRTFANHFTCKEEAVALGVLAYDAKVEAEVKLSGFPDGTTPLDILHEWFKTRLTAEVLGRMRQLATLTRAYPALEPYFLSVLHKLQTAAREIMSELLDERYPDGYSDLLIGAAFGAIQPIIDGSLRVLLPDEAAAEAPGAIPFDRYLDIAFGYLRNGF